MTAAELDALEALANAATPGPWVVVFDASGRVAWIKGPKHVGVVDSYGSTPSLDCSGSDGEFIAAAREAVPKLIAQIRDLGRQLSGLCRCFNNPPCDICREFGDKDDA